MSTEAMLQKLETISPSIREGISFCVKIDSHAIKFISNKKYYLFIFDSEECYTLQCMKTRRDWNRVTR